MPRNFTRAEDEVLLKKLYLADHEDLPIAIIARRYGVTKNAIVGALHRIRQTYRQDNGVGNGTMPPRWWKQ